MFRPSKFPFLYSVKKPLFFFGRSMGSGGGEGHPGLERNGWRDPSQPLGCAPGREVDPRRNGPKSETKTAQRKKNHTDTVVAEKHETRSDFHEKREKYNSRRKQAQTIAMLLSREKLNPKRKAFERENPEDMLREIGLSDGPPLRAQNIQEQSIRPKPNLPVRRKPLSDQTMRCGN